MEVLLVACKVWHSRNANGVPVGHQVLTRYENGVRPGHSGRHQNSSR